jgi:transcriptional antiterminator NusG
MASDATTAQDGAEGTQAQVHVSKSRGKRWYIIHAHSGFEKKVGASILEQAAQKGLEGAIEEVVVPTEDVMEVRRGKKVQAERKFFPGYVLVKMDMNDATWQLIKSTPKVTGFLGGKGIRPQPITDREADAIFAQIQAGVDAPRQTVQFEIGEQVKISDGPFESFVGTVEDVDDGRSKLKVSVSIFGRATPVELNFDQVTKILA